jgi:hypothetical protein
MILISQSCNKEHGSIGTNLRNDLLDAIYTDTTTVLARSVFEDTLNTTNLASNFLGYLKDEIFGTTIAGIYTQFIPDASVYNFGQSPQLDSIVLTLRYSGGFYGDTLYPFGIKVYRITEDISSDNQYYQNNVIAYSSENLTYQPEYILYPKPNTKAVADTVFEPHVRIRLCDELGNFFLRSASQMTSESIFKSFFKGLYICPKPLANDGVLVSFSLTNIISGIQLYYKNNTIPRHISFLITSQKVVRVSTYQHDYKKGSPDFVDQVNDSLSLLGKEILYVQSMGGVKTKISFLHIKEALKDKNIVINKAELVITNYEDNTSKYPPPARLSIQGINKTGELVFLPDLTNLEYWGGTFDATKKEYRFRITRYIQDIILKDNYQPSIYLVVEGAARNANRLLFYGTNPTTDYSKRLRLEIYYTEY